MENEKNENEEKEIPSESNKDLKDAEIERLKNDILYLRADFDNFRKRCLREQEQAVKFGNERLILELGTIINHLERALENTPKDSPETGLIQGLKLTHAEFLQLLQRFGVEFIGAVDEKFDPSRHEAVAEREGVSHEKVLEVLERGCVLHGRLIKPARVVVSKKENV